MKENILIFVNKIIFHGNNKNYNKAVRVFTFEI